MKTFEGVYTALITPMTSAGEIDRTGLRLLLRQQMAAQVDGIVVLGTTGEAPTLSVQEKMEVIEIARQEINGKTQLIVGTGSYSTAQTVVNTIEAEKLGADACLIVTPYYNKPTQDGIFLHFQAVANSCALPIIVYNIQGRTGQNIQTATLLRISELPTVTAVKEASGNIMQMTEVIQEICLAMKRPLSVLSGDDALTYPLLALGGHGVISVASNLFPEKIVTLYQLAKNGSWNEARTHHYDLMDLFKNLFIETNPIPIKYAMHLLGLPSGPCRLPLSPLTEASKQIIEQLMAKFLAAPSHWS